MFTKHELETILYTLEGYLQSTDDDKYGDELVRICDKIVEQLEPPKVIVTDDDYADKVDTLVSKMKAHNDKEFTHDSEGC